MLFFVQFRTLQHVADVPYLYDPIGACGQQVAPCDVQVHVHHWMPGFVERCHGHTVVVCDDDVALVADPHVKLVAHDGNAASVGAALVTHRLATLSTVVLSDPDRFLVHHCLDVPEERTRTPLARVALSPLRSFYPLGCHVPEHKRRVLACRDECLSWTMIT